MKADTDHLVEFINVQKTYDGEELVVKNLNLKIKPGEFLTMLGPSGSMAAWEAAKGGASVCMLEKDRDIGYPVRCGEAAGESAYFWSISICPMSSYPAKTHASL